MFVGRSVPRICFGTNDERVCMNGNKIWSNIYKVWFVNFKNWGMQSTFARHVQANVYSDFFLTNTECLFLAKTTPTMRAWPIWQCVVGLQSKQIRKQNNTPVTLCHMHLAVPSSLMTEMRLILYHCTCDWVILGQLQKSTAHLQWHYNSDI